jgi:hypothetical protein
VIAFLVYGIGIPAGFATVFIVWRKDIVLDQRLRVAGEGNSPLTNSVYHVRQRFAKLYMDFRAEQYAWKLALIGRKFALAAIVMLLDTAPLLQAAFALLVLSMSYVAHMHAKPFAPRTPVSKSFLALADMLTDEEKQAMRKPADRKKNAWQKFKSLCGRLMKGMAGVMQDANAGSGMLLTTGKDPKSDTSVLAQARKAVLERSRKDPERMRLAARAHKNQLGFAADFNRLEEALLVSSIVMLAGGMIFDSLVWERGSIPYTVFLILLILIAFVPSFLFFMLLAYEVYRSLKFSSLAAEAQKFDEDRMAETKRLARGLASAKMALTATSKPKGKWMLAMAKLKKGGGGAGGGSSLLAAAANLSSGSGDAAPASDGGHPDSKQGTQRGPAPKPLRVQPSDRTLTNMITKAMQEDAAKAAEETAQVATVLGSSSLSRRMSGLQALMNFTGPAHRTGGGIGGMATLGEVGESGESMAGDSVEEEDDGTVDAVSAMNPMLGVTSKPAAARTGGDSRSTIHSANPLASLLASGSVYTRGAASGPARPRRSNGTEQEGGDDALGGQGGEAEAATAAGTRSRGASGDEWW